MVDLSTDNKFNAWLEDQPQDVSIAIAARAAWRVLPLLARFKSGKKDQRKILSQLLRGSASALVAGKYPTSVDGRRSAVVAAQSAAFAAPVIAVENIDVKSAAAATATAARSVEAAFFAARSVDGAVPDDTTDTAYFAARSVHSASFASPSEETDAAARWDAAAMANRGLSPQRLLDQPLWPDGTPDFAVAWAPEFSRALSKAGDGFSLWADWYDAVLKGGPRAHFDRAFVRAINNLALWEREPAEINAQIMAWVEEERGKGVEEEPLSTFSNLPSPVEFDVTQSGLIKAVAGAIALPAFKYPGNEADHAEQNKIVGMLAEQLIAALAKQKYQVREEYQEMLTEIRQQLPSIPKGNLKWADTSFRSLVALFNAEAHFLPEPFAARLKTFCEEYQGLRAFYDELQAHYARIRKGKISRPLPTDLRRRFQKTIASATPYPFDPSVQNVLGHADKAAVLPHVAPDEVPPNNASVIRPQPDPIADVDPEKDRDVTFTSVANGVIKAVERGEKIYKGAEGWAGLPEKLRPVWEGIRQWFETDGGGGPMMPPPSMPV